MIYDLSKEIDVQRAQRRFDKLLEEKTVITLTKKAKRTLRQNNYLYLILSWFALETGYTKDESKQLYKSISPDIFRYEKEGMMFFKSTTDLDTSEMTLSIDRFRNYSANQANIYLPEPGETQFLQEIEIEISRSQYI